MKTSGCPFEAEYPRIVKRYRVYLSKEAKTDLAMWAVFLREWNRVSLLIEPNETSCVETYLQMSLEALVSEAISKSNGSMGHGWKACSRKYSRKICFQELYPIVVAMIVWGSAWAQKQTVFHCDNMGVLIKGFSRSADVM